MAKANGNNIDASTEIKGKIFKKKICKKFKEEENRLY